MDISILQKENGKLEMPTQPERFRMRKLITNEIIKIFNKIPLTKNLSKKELIGDLLIGILESRKVYFKEIALHFESEAVLQSIERRIQLFFKDYDFDYQQVCLLLLFFYLKVNYNYLFSAQDKRYFERCLVDGVWCNTILKKLDNKYFLFLIGNLPAKQLGGLYQDR